MSDKQTRIVVFGKGGVGKSTFAANLSAHFALQGYRVLHVGCDPKADSSFLLLPGLSQPRTVVSVLTEHGSSGKPSDIINTGRHGIDCIEVGGPEPGIGCGGRGIARALEYMETWRILEEGNYDVVLFDVLGDVVCGGFAAPLRQGFGDRVLIVASEDEMSFYAANNISKAVVRYAPNGVALAGLVVNRRGPADTRLNGVEFAERIGTQVVGTLPISTSIEAARQARRTLLEHAPDDPYAQVVRKVANYVRTVNKASLKLPVPMDSTAFHRFVTGDELEEPTPLESAIEVEDERKSGPALEPLPADELLGREVIGGAGSRTVFHGLLGFDTPTLTKLKATVRSVALKPDGDVWVAIEIVDIGARRLIVRPPTKGAFVSTPRLGLAYSGGDMTPQFQQFLQWTAKRLSRHRFQQLVDVVAQDPESTVRGEAGRPTARRQFKWNVRAGNGALAALAADQFQPQRVDSKTDGSLEVAVTTEAGSVVVTLSPPEHGPAIVQGASFNAGYQGEVDPQAGESAARQVLDALAGRSLDECHNLIRSDPSSVELGRPGSGGIARDENAPPSWARFLASEQFARNIFNLFRVNVPHVAIEHCDRECNFATPIISNNEFNFLNYPWLDPGQHPQDPYLKNTEPGTYYTSQLKELDVITGSTARLAGILEEVVENLGDEQLIMLNNTCVPVVAGDDVDSLVKGLSKRCPIPIMSMGSHIGEDPFVALFTRLRERDGFKQPTVDRAAINLVGYPAGKGVPELERLLNQLGITINSRPFPEIELSLFEDYLRAPVQVFYPLDHFDELYDKLLGDLPLATVRPAAPYGPNATREWLRVVAAQLDRSQAWHRLSESLLAGFEPRWDAVRRRASRHALGFVLAGDDARILTTPGICHGIPVFDLLSEAGFQFDLLAHEEAEVPAELHPDVRRFGTEVELGEALLDSPARAFYSDFYFDARLSRTGKSVFSLQHFTMGFEGALATVESLLSLCELPFYARYGHYLGER